MFTLERRAFRGLTSGRDELDVVALEDDLVLQVCRVDTGNARGHLDPPDVLLTQDVTDLHQRVLLRDGHVDGEVSVHGPHLLSESLQCTRGDNYVHEREPSLLNTMNVL